MQPTTDAPPQLTEWATSLYARDDVRDACIALQDEHGADVVAILATVWASMASGFAIEGDALADTVRWATSERQWNDDVVRPLRRARRAVPDGPLGQQIARVEIEAELTQLHRLSVAGPSDLVFRALGPAREVGSIAIEYAARLFGVAQPTPATVALIERVLAAAAATSSTSPDPGLDD